jgi:glycerol kinase
MQRLADILDAPVDRPPVLETTAMGAAYLAGYQAGLLPEPAVFAKRRKREKRFTPKMKPATREMKYSGWKEAVRKLLA